MERRTMDKTDKIITAIEQLAVNLTGQIAAVRSELQTDIARVVAKVDAVASVQADHGQQIAELRAGQSRLEAGAAELTAAVAELKTGQTRIMEHLDVAELRGRVDEQGRTIAQLIPTRVAAVPGR